MGPALGMQPLIHPALLHPPSWDGIPCSATKPACAASCLLLPWPGLAFQILQGARGLRDRLEHVGQGAGWLIMSPYAGPAVTGRNLTVAATPR